MVSSEIAAFSPMSWMWSTAAAEKNWKWRKARHKLGLTCTNQRLTLTLDAGNGFQYPWMVAPKLKSIYFRIGYHHSFRIHVSVCAVGKGCKRWAGVDEIRKVLEDAKIQTRALCLRHKSSDGFQSGCPLPRRVDLDSYLHPWNWMRYMLVATANPTIGFIDLTISSKLVVFWRLDCFVGSPLAGPKNLKNLKDLHNGTWRGWIIYCFSILELRTSLVGIIPCAQSTSKDTSACSCKDDSLQGKQQRDNGPGRRSAICHFRPASFYRCYRVSLVGWLGLNRIVVTGWLKHRMPRARADLS